ncbi:cytochrome P450 [Sphingomonas rhizophila]|uniref:Cytochrome P450 n=1 Tax=Sphingomonas rhizophila TaxID=2071607 RepID=A0A7G9S9N5_9SPHN|nr:cytochrome P450 [Sphingomonas rhizophila]QNN64560.1 cytochrome P450 [Sphingomonas rhizophila]
MKARFVPPHPPRPAGPVATWRGFIGERGRTAVYGWSERAFQLDGFSRKIFGFRVHVVTHPDWIGEVLLDHQGDLTKPDIARRLLAPVIGEGLLTAEGELWRSERKIVAASFAPNAVEALRPVFDAAAADIMQGWQDGMVRDLASDSTLATMSVIARALFGGDARLTSAQSLRHITNALEGFSQPRMQALLGLPLFPVGAKARAGAAGQRYLRETLAAVVDERIAGRADDWLSGLVAQLVQKFGEQTGRRLAIDNAATFYLAGHETTANALAWTMYLLGQQSDLQEELAVEAASAMASVDWLSPGLVRRVPKIYAVLQESMRLYPPVPRLDRQARAHVNIGSLAVEPGDIVSIWPWLMHRHEKWWEDPDAFVADRFLHGTRHRFQYLPFGAGPRICVGAQFATIEALGLLVPWLSRWRFRPIGTPVRTSGLVTLRPAPGVPLRLERRA